MRKRGRKGAADLAVLMPPDARMVRPLPPDHLTDEQASEWERVVNAMPGGWFPPETLALLVAYCQHVIRARRVAQLLDQVEESKEAFDLESYDRLGKMAERESRTIASLATRMRITQQALFDRTKPKGKGGGGARPWATDWAPPAKLSK